MQGQSQPKVTLIKDKCSDETYELFEFCVEGAPERSARLVDVVLLHGLTGHFMKTWGGSVVRAVDKNDEQAKPERETGEHSTGSDGEEGVVTDCWVRNLAIEKMSMATFWTLGYPAPLFEKQLGKDPSSLGEDSRKILQVLVRAGLGKKPVIFVTHSLGGLLARAILTESFRADNLSEKREIFNHTEGIIFAGTPHAGSYQVRWRFLVPALVELAASKIGALVVAIAAIFVGGTTLTVSLSSRTWVMPVVTLLGTLAVLLAGVWMKSFFAPGPDVLRLDPANPALRELKSSFRRARSERTFLTASFFEEKRLWGLFLVVPSWSADPGVTDCEPIGINANHVQICKGKGGSLKDRTEEYIAAACRGRVGGESVFRKKLELLVGDDSTVRKAFEVLFNSKQKDGKADETFRVFLRERIRQGTFVAAQPELDLALSSSFDEDELVWNLWYERTLAEDLRCLRKKAEADETNDFGVQPGPPTLIPFYRSLRMIEHISTGDLDAPGYTNRIDRDLLLKLVIDAGEKLDKLCPVTTWKDDASSEQRFLDEDGQTRRLLLRISSTIRAIQATQLYVGRGPMKTRGSELDTEFGEWRAVFDKALKEFRTKLNIRAED